jgi:hypothetical protein
VLSTIQRIEKMGKRTKEDASQEEDWDFANNKLAKTNKTSKLKDVTNTTINNSTSSTASASSASKIPNQDFEKSTTSTASVRTASNKSNPVSNKPTTSKGNLLESTQKGRTLILGGGDHKKLTKSEILECEESTITIPNMMIDVYSTEYEKLIKTPPLLVIPFNAVFIKAINSQDEDTLSFLNIFIKNASYECIKLLAEDSILEEYVKSDLIQEVIKRRIDLLKERYKDLNKDELDDFWKMPDARFDKNLTITKFLNSEFDKIQYMDFVAQSDVENFSKRYKTQIDSYNLNIKIEGKGPNTSVD